MSILISNPIASLSINSVSSFKQYLIIDSIAEMKMTQTKDIKDVIIITNKFVASK